MTNQLAERMHPAGDRIITDRPNHALPDDLIALATSGFIAFGEERGAPEVVAMGVYDFLAAARDAGYPDIEHGEALEVLEYAKGKIEQDQRSQLEDAVDAHFTTEWFLSHFDTDPDEYFMGIEKGEYSEEIHSEYCRISRSTIPRDNIFAVHDDVFTRYLLQRIADMKDAYYRETQIRLTELQTTIEEPQGEHND